MEETENSSPVDVERLREISGDDAELINEIIDLYLSQTRQSLDELKTAIAEGESDAVYKAAHKALGSSVTCGMEAVVPMLKELEHLGREGAFENAEHIRLRAESGFASIEEYFRANREQLFS